MTELFEVACFVSAKPSSSHWVVSGLRSDVEAVARMVQAVPDARTVGEAGTDETYFARFEFPATAAYRDVGGAIYEAQRRGLLISALTPLLPFCPDGRAEDVGDSHAETVTVGIIGDDNTLAAVRSALPWARFFTVRLVDGREGIGFEPEAQDGDRYADFVDAVAEGRFSPAEVVLLRR